MSKEYLGEDDLDLISNSASRIPVCLCLDISGSMYNCIKELEGGVEAFYDAVRNSETAKNSCEISIVTFASKAMVAEDYSTVDTKQPLKFKAYGGTAMTDGAVKALELLESRKAKYKAKGVDYYQPWFVIMSDGEPNDPEAIIEIQNKIKSMEESKKLVVFALGIGDDVNMDIMNNFSKKGAKKLKEYNFSEFFEWLGKSVSIVSTSQCGEKVVLDVSDMDDWAEI